MCFTCSSWCKASSKGPPPFFTLLPCGPERSLSAVTAAVTHRQQTACLLLLPPPSPCPGRCVLAAQVSTAGTESWEAGSKGP